MEDGQFLFEGRRNTGAVYLAGYAVECMLKAMILSALPARKRKMMLDSFRGQQAHDYEWLKAKYRECQGLTVPREVERDFILVNSWGTELRYKSGNVHQKQCERFLLAVERVVAWGEGRLG